MNPSRKTDARSSIRYTAQDTPRGADPKFLVRAARVGRVITLLLVATLTLAGVWRWHQAGANAPLKVAEVDGPTAVLIIQDGDCPDRRAAMTRWLEQVGRAAPGDDLRLRVAAVGPRGRGITRLEGIGPLDLPSLDAREAERAGRALLRSPARGTPALLLLDGEGHPMFAATFTQTGPGPRLEVARAMILALTPQGAPAFRVLQPQEADPWNF